MSSLQGALGDIGIKGDPGLQGMLGKITIVVV
jgi:hypothetical protein